MKNLYRFKLNNIFPTMALITSVALVVPSYFASQSSVVAEAFTKAIVEKMESTSGGPFSQHFSHRICEQLNYSVDMSSVDSHEPTPAFDLSLLR